jgi:hypothetical protein
MIVTSESYFRAGKGVERRKGGNESQANYQMGHVFRIVRLTDSSQKGKFDGMNEEAKSWWYAPHTLDLL